MFAKIEKKIQKMAFLNYRKLTIFFEIIFKSLIAILKVNNVLTPYRKTMTNVELPSGVVLPKGMTFTIDLANMNTNERVWGKGALEFNPARFLNAEETKKR